LPQGSTIFIGGYPAYQTLGVPIFSSDWDVDGMVKTEYDDWTVAAYPILNGSKLVCTPEGMQLVGEGLKAATSRLVPYGEARLLDLEDGRHVKPRTLRHCRAVVQPYGPGPFYLSSAY